MATTRYNTYTNIHRGLRALMGQTLVEVGRTDPANAAQLDQTLAAVDSLLDLCASHLEHEDRFIHPAMEARRPGSSHKTAADHGHHVDSIATLRRTVERVRSWGDDERGECLTALYQSLSAFVAENFEHMLVEESYNNAVLWDCYSDAEIIAIEQALVASIPPEENARVLGIMVPAISAPERAELLGLIRQQAPREVFAGLLEMLLPRVPQHEREQLAALA